MVTQELKNKYAGLSCTLNGIPAKVCGRLKDFATIIDDNGLRAEWSWESVAGIMDKGGKFQT